jgi:hypothetical protein
MKNWHLITSSSKSTLIVTMVRRCCVCKRGKNTEISRVRKGGRYPKMQAVLDRLRQVAVDEPLSVLALNTYLAALLEDPLQRSRLDDALTALRESSLRWNMRIGRQLTNYGPV